MTMASLSPHHVVEYEVWMLRATQEQTGNQSIAWRVNPDIAVVGYPQVPVFANGDVIFRDQMENNLLYLDLCTLSPPPQGC